MGGLRGRDSHVLSGQGDKAHLSVRPQRRGILAYQTASGLPEIQGVIATYLLDQREPLVRKNVVSSGWMAEHGLRLISKASAWLGFIKVPIKWVGNMKAIVNNEELAEVLMRDRCSSGTKVPVAFLHTLLKSSYPPGAGALLAGVPCCSGAPGK